MNWRTLGVVLMAVGLLAAGTGTFGVGLIEADRSSEINSVADGDRSEDANYFDTADQTQTYTTINQYSKTVLSVFNQFGQPVTATEVAVDNVRPVNASVNDTTTDSSALSIAGPFTEGSTADPDSEVPIRSKCNPEFNETVRGDHEITVSIAVEGEDSGAEISLDRTVTAAVECN